jgi:DNA-binding LytR/AlgR family response regulator
MRENRPHLNAILGKRDKAVEPTGADVRVALTAACQRGSPERTTGFRTAESRTGLLAAGRSARIAIKSKGRILFIDAADVIAVQAKGNYVLLLSTSSSHTLRESISTMEEKLNLHGFVRIHRSVLVNAALVEEIHPLSTGEYVLCVRGGKEFTVTRTYKSNLQLLAQLWIGTEGFAAD